MDGAVRLLVEDCDNPQVRIITTRPISHCDCPR